VPCDEDLETIQEVILRLRTAVGDSRSSIEDGIRMVVNHSGGLFDIGAVSMLSGVEKRDTVTFGSVSSASGDKDVVVVCAMTVGVVEVVIDVVVAVEITGTCCFGSCMKRRYCCFRSKSLFSNPCFLTFSAIAFSKIAVSFTH
jgi:hypothetical protein